MGNNMKYLILIVIILLALYSLLRNLFVLPGQLIWIPREGYFFSVFLPLLMLMSACTALIKKKSINILLLSLGAMVIDAIYHLAIAVYHIYC